MCLVRTGIAFNPYAAGGEFGRYKIMQKKNRKMSYDICVLICDSLSFKISVYIRLCFFFDTVYRPIPVCLFQTMMSRATYGYKIIYLDDILYVSSLIQYIDQFLFVCCF